MYGLSDGEVRRLVNESTFTPGGAPAGPRGESTQVMSATVPRVRAHWPRSSAQAFPDAMAEAGPLDSDPELDPEAEFAALLAPDPATQKRDRLGPTGRAMPVFPDPPPVERHGPAKV